MLRVLAFTLLLLALPVGMFVWGLRDFLHTRNNDDITELSMQETSGLRIALERVIEDKWGEAPAIASDSESSGLPILEWNVCVKDWPDVLQIIDAQAATHSTEVILLQNGSAPEYPARFMVAPRFWRNELCGILEQHGFCPPTAPELQAGASFLFLEIHALPYSGE